MRACSKARWRERSNSLSSRATRWRWFFGYLCCSASVGCQQRVLLGYEQDAPTSDAGDGSLGSATGVDGALPTGVSGVPEPGETLWSAGAETGDLTEWTDDGQGFAYQAAQARVVAATGHSRSGSYALEATIEAIGDVLPQAVMYRSGDMPEGYYSAWFCIEENYSANFWVIMKFQGDRPYQGVMTNDRFDIDLSRSPDDDRLHLELDEFGGSSTLSPIPVPVGEWFRVEAYYKSSPDDDGRLVVWQDGELVFDTGERPTAPSSFVAFGVGVAAWRVQPLPATVWIDDVQVRGVQ